MTRTQYVQRDWRRVEGMALEMFLFGTTYKTLDPALVVGIHARAKVTGMTIAFCVATMVGGKYIRRDRIGVSLAFTTSEWYKRVWMTCIYSAKSIATSYFAVVASGQLTSACLARSVFIEVGG